jgi:hypothetical protein
MLTNNPWDWLIYPSIYRVEWLLLAGLSAAMILLPRRVRLFSLFVRKFDRLATHRRAAILVAVVAVMLGRAALLPILPIPRPGIADEFGYLLTADTFLHGRLTNPTSPMWVHFETFHVFHTPSYQSQYPIGYSVILAAAWGLIGNPWWGVFFTTALMCGALTWMLQAWIPRRWALIGGLLAAVRVGLFSYWMNSFWGGSLAALGGCLFFGSLPRLVPGLGKPNIGNSSPLVYSFAGAAGLAMLAHTRPFEGLLVTFPGILLLFWFLLKQRHNRSMLINILIPALSVLTISFAALLIYQKAVTGHSFESPYQIASEQYHISRPFFFQPLLLIPKYRHLEFRYIYVHFEPELAERMGYFWGFWEVMFIRAQDYWKFFVGPLLSIPLAVSTTCLKDRNLRLVWVCLAILFIGVFFQSWIQDHYLAPAYCLLILVLLQGARKLRTLRFGGIRIGQRFSAVLPIVCLLMLAIRAAAFDEHQIEVLTHWPPNWAFSTQRLWDRDQIEDKVKSSPDKVLIIVRYRATFHSPHKEWVYNGADLQNGKVLWARSMSAEENCQLVHYYQNRKFWVVDQWGGVTRFTLENEAQICDPSNLIYEVNEPASYYESGEARRATRHSFLRPRQMY